MYYNKELLEQNGIELPSTDASKPWSWEEFVENAKKINQGCQWERAGGMQALIRTISWYMEQ